MKGRYTAPCWRHKAVQAVILVCLGAALGKGRVASQRFLGRLCLGAVAEDAGSTLREHACVFAGHRVLLSRILLIMYMFLNIANAETCKLCRVHDP
jgi:hypothetical protein